MLYKVIYNNRISEAYSEENLHSFAQRGYLKGHMVLIDTNGNRFLAKDLFPGWFGEYADFTDMDFSSDSEDNSEVNLWKMVGSDGKIYGPYTKEMLQSFIEQRRITPVTRLIDINENIIRADELLDFGRNRYNYHANNDSGHGNLSFLPYDLHGLNWGAFVFPLFWGISHNVWFAFLSLIPAFRIIVRLILLFKGNEWAWKSRKFASKEEFVQVQNIWRNWGLGYFALMIFVGICSAIFL